MGLKQQMKQTLGMTMTPQLQQAIKILQMSVLELQQEVNTALTENPTLEESSEDGSPQTPEEFAKENTENHGMDATEMVPMPDKLTEQTPTSGGGEEYDWQSYLEGSGGSHASPMNTTKNFNPDELPSYEQILSRPTTLYDHLMWQLRMAIHEGEADANQVMAIGEEIIGNLNEDAYLTVLVEEIAQTCKAEKSQVEGVLNLIQSFDPPGVAARNLQECLLIQAETLGENEACETIIKNHMAELENKNYPAIAKALDLDMHFVIELCETIHNMEPRPGRSFSTTEPQYIVPDIYVVKLGNEFTVVLNEEGIPRLKVSKEYQEQIVKGTPKSETKSYLKEKLKDAAWLIKSIYQRQRSVYRVTEALVKRQKDFFEKGPKHLKPLVLRDIADELELHESTISRVTTNKFVHTPHGIFELKYFFSSGISRSDGQDDLASESVKIKIKELIESENPKNPLSDQQLADMLADTKINIARRTVAKYREALGVLPSSKRKKYF